jgi:hypothetical protein
VFTAIRSAKEGPSLLCGIATATPQHFTVTSRQTATCQPRSSLRRHDGSRCGPLRCPPDSSRQALKGLDDAGSSRTSLRNCSPVIGKRSLTPGWACRSGVSFHLPSKSPSPPNLGVLTRPGFDGAHSASPALPAQAAPPRCPASTEQAAKVSPCHSNRQHLTAHVDRGLAYAAALPAIDLSSVR